MTHLSEDELAGQALDLPEARSAGQAEHLAGCATCRDELAALRRVVELGRDPQTAQVRLPYRADLWSRIQAELADDAGGTVPSPPAASPPAPPAPAPPAPAPPAPAPSPEPRRRPGSRRALVLLGAAAGLLVGAAGVLGLERVRDPGPGGPAPVVAQTPLTALPGHTGSGTAELVEVTGTPELRVRLDGAAASPQAFHEVWLLNRDGRRMYAIGVLPLTGTGSYPLPPALAGGLAGYTTVDVSVEPYDGNAAHSTDSVVRGVLPG